MLTTDLPLPIPGVLGSGVPIIETSEELLPARNVGWKMRQFPTACAPLGERGRLTAADAVLVGRPLVSNFTRRPPPRNGPGCGSASWLARPTHTELRLNRGCFGLVLPSRRCMTPNTPARPRSDQGPVPTTR